MKNNTDFKNLINDILFINDLAESHYDAWKTRYDKYRSKGQIKTDLYVNHDPSLEIEAAEEKLGRELTDKEQNSFLDKFNKRVIAIATKAL